MRRLYNPGIAVPGAQRVYDGDGVPTFDKKGRPIWTLPRPTSIVIHKGIVRLGTFKTKRENVEVPVYRGLDARLARNFRSYIKRMRRKEAAQKAKDADKIEIPDDLVEGEE